MKIIPLYVGKRYWWINKNVKAEDWSLIASLTQDIKSDSSHIPRLLELRAKIRAGIYHVDKDLLVDSILKRCYPQATDSE